MIFRLHAAAALAAAFFMATPVFAGPDYSPSKKQQYPSPNFNSPDADTITLRGAGVVGPVDGGTIKIGGVPQPLGPVLQGKAATGINTDITSLRAMSGPIMIESNSPSADIQYGNAFNIKGGGGATSPVVGAQLNAYSTNTSGTRSVWGAALEAWSGDFASAPSVGATLIGIEPAVISQRHDQDNPLVGADIVFKNRPDNAASPKQGKGANQYNKNGRAIQISSQVRGATGEYVGWPVGILFTAESLDRSIDRLAVGIDMSAVDSSRLAAAIRMPANGKLTWDGDARQVGISDGTFLYSVSGLTAFAVSSAGDVTLPTGAKISSLSGAVVTFGGSTPGTGIKTTLFERSGDPTSADIPSNQCADWVNTSGTVTFKRWCNYQGSLRAITYTAQ